MEENILNLFCIGEEFDLHQFDLEYLETKTDKNGISYQYYLYVGQLDNEKIQHIILAYNCDVLRGVFVTLQK